MDELINTLVADYKADRITWHDIQDQVEAYVISLDGKGLTMNWETIRVRQAKANIILAEIEKRIGGKNND